MYDAFMYVVYGGMEVRTVCMYDVCMYGCKFVWVYVCMDGCIYLRCVSVWMPVCMYGGM